MKDKNDFSYDLRQFAVLKSLDMPKANVSLSDIPQELRSIFSSEKEITSELNVMIHEVNPRVELKDCLFRRTKIGDKFLEFMEERLKAIREENQEFEEKEKTKEKALEILKDPCLLYKVKQILDEKIVGEDENKLQVFLIALTKDLGSEKALACILCGKPASGKSHILHKVLWNMLDEYSKDNLNGSLVWITRLTPTALEYYKINDYTGKVLYVEEAVGVDQAKNTIRPMFSEKGLKILVTRKVEGGGFETYELGIKGCPVFFTTSIYPPSEEQWSSRLRILQTDESEEQTKKILEYQKKLALIPIQNKSETKILKEIVNQLKKFDDILIPYFNEIDFPTKEVRARRDLPMFRTLIQVSAYLHQFQRPKIKIEDKEYLIATFADYYVAYTLIKRGLKGLIYGLPDNILNILDICRAIKEDDKEEITAKKVAEHSNYSQRTIRAYMTRLVDVGLLTVEKKGRENVYDIKPNIELTELLIDIEELKKRFDEKKFKNYLLSLGLNGNELTYADVIGNIYDCLSGIPVYRVENKQGDVV
jgi:response regulator of citrate/malate metabolism